MRREKACRTVAPKSVSRYHCLGLEFDTIKAKPMDKDMNKQWKFFDTNAGQEDAVGVWR